MNFLSPLIFKLKNLTKFIGDESIHDSKWKSFSPNFIKTNSFIQKMRETKGWPFALFYAPTLGMVSKT